MKVCIDTFTLNIDSCPYTPRIVAKIFFRPSTFNFYITLCDPWLIITG